MSWSPSILPPNFSLPTNFYYPLVDINFRCLVWVHLFFFFFHLRCVKWKCLPCKGAFKVKGCPNYFWIPSLVFRLKTLLFTLLFPSFIDILLPIHLLWLNLHACFCETFRPKLLGLHAHPLNASIGFSPHLLWGD